MKFTQKDLKGQADEVRNNSVADCKNECFATFSDVRNRSKLDAREGFSAANPSVGVVKYEHPLFTAPRASNRPGYLDLIADRLASTPKPRGRHGRKRKPVTKAFERLSKGEKLAVIFDRAFQREAVAFSLNFSGKKIAKLSASADPARDLSCAMNRNAKQLLGFALPIAFTFELSDDGRLHCHGVAILPDWSSETINSFRQVLKRAGGVMHGLGSGRQLDVRVLTDVKGWNGYRLKDAARTIETLGTVKITYVSRELLRVAREDHEADLARHKRGIMRRAKSKKTKPTKTGTERCHGARMHNPRGRACRRGNRSPRHSLSQSRHLPPARTLQELGFPLPRRRQPP